ncbi:MAG: ATP-grasp domain-containing protein [Calditrichaeota bacterium]|nr:ATP-grasp domain-containing protein [Calditrichota bacterium]MCB9088842.1 ATP-grasp domain-containing protein [Calditrichia bacterium]
MSLTIAITGVNAVESPGPGVAVARSLMAQGGQDYRLIALGYDAIDPGLFDRELFRAGYLLPYPREGREALQQRLDEIRQRTPIDIIIPTLDSEIAHFAGLEAELRESGTRMFIPTTAQIEARSKANLAELGRKFDFAVPRTVTVHHLADLEAALREVGFPLLVKGIYYDAYICHDQPQALSYARLLANKWGYPLLVQEYIQGEEFNAAALGGGDGGIVSALCMKKILLTDKGKGWAGVSIRNEQLLDLTRRFISATRWRGALEMETLLARRDQKLYILEINPRFPAWIYLGVAAEINLPAHYVDLARGRKLEPVNDYQVGKLFTHYTIDLIGEISQLDSLLSRGEIHYPETNPVQHSTDEGPTS